MEECYFMIGSMYSVFLDGNFVGTCASEYEVYDTAQDHVNGHDILFDDDMDRVTYSKIDVNQFYRYGNNVCDKLSDDSWLCASSNDVEDSLNKLNSLAIEKERLEAKIRAITL